MSLAAYIVAARGPGPPHRGRAAAMAPGAAPRVHGPLGVRGARALPLTPNGKVDRQALPDPGGPGLPTAADFVPPRGPIEEALAEIWAELLGGEPIGAHDDFFERGGHSLMAMQLLARVRRPSTSRRRSRTSSTSRPSHGWRASSSRPWPTATAPRPRRSAGRPRRPRCRPRSPSSGSGSSTSSSPAAPPTTSPPPSGSTAGSISRPSAAPSTRSSAATRCCGRRCRDDGGIPRQVIADWLELPLTVEDSGLPEDEREIASPDRVREEAERPFDLARGPLVRAGCSAWASDEHIVQVTMHHIISDGWSLGVLIREVSALYEAFLQGEPSPLPEPPIQYADYAAWQRDWLQGEGLQVAARLLEAQLAGLPAGAAHRPAPAARPSQRGGERSTTLPKTTLEAVRALGRQEGATLYMTLLAAFQVLLHRYSGQDDIAVGSPIAGRTRPELEGLIGFFVNTLVLRGDLSGDPGFRELLRRIRRTAIEAYAHQDLPFEKLVTVAQPDRDSGRSPLFQVMFAVQNAPLPALQSPELL